jgi:hypothetical protein
MSWDNGFPSETARVEGAAVRHDWLDVANAAREATFSRLHALVLERDPVPEYVLAAARSSYELRSVDDELAGLVYDSMIDDELLAGVRSGRSTVRQLTFAARDIVLEMEVSETRRLVGQVVPPQAAVVELRHRGGTTPVMTDELGCFHVPAIPDGPVSFRCRPARADADSIATSWITL